MNNKAVRFLLLSLIFFAPLSRSFAQGVSQNFDSVTPPALPAGWSSVTLAGSQSAVTSTLNFRSAPNTAYLPDPIVLSDTALVSPEFSFSTGTPTYKLYLQFYHKRGMESPWDGGVLEISVNRAPFVDVTHASIGGAFASGEYNIPALNPSANPLANRPVWSGSSAGFEFVDLRIPSLSSGDSVQFRFRLGSDHIIGSSGWFIDDVKIIPFVDTAVEIIPSQAEVPAGQPARFTARVINPGSVEVSGGMLFLSVPSGDEIRSVSIPAASIFQKMGTWLGLSQSMIPMPAFGAYEVEVTVSTSNPPTAAAILTLDEPAGLAGLSFGAAFSSSSPALPEGGLVKVPVMMSPANFCIPVPGPLWPQLAGNFIIGAYNPDCTLGQQGLNLQEAGAIGYLMMPGSFSSLNPSPPFVIEPATAGLTVPVGGLDPLAMSLLASALSGPPGSVKMTVQSKRQPSRTSLVLEAITMPPYDSVMFNNMKAVSVDVYMDQDQDGTADDREACPADAGKLSAGACGCGTPDTDANSNGVADCLLTADLRADVLALKQSVQLLSLSKFRKQKLLRSSIKLLQTSVLGRLSQPGIQVSSSSVNLAKLGKAAQTKVAKLTKNTREFAKNKKVALKSLDALLGGLAA